MICVELLIRKITLILVKCYKLSENTCKLIVNVVFVATWTKRNAFQRNVRAVLISICVPAQKDDPFVFDACSFKRMINNLYELSSDGFNMISLDLNKYHINFP